MRVVGCFLLSLLFSSPAWLACPAQAQDVTPSDTLLQRRLEELDQKIRIIERQREIEKEEADKKVKSTPIVGAGKDGFFLKSADGDYLLKIRALSQADGRFFIAEQGDANVTTFGIRRMRLLFEGTLSRIFDFRLMPDFAGSVIVLQDAYLDIRFVPELKLRSGKFKEPVGLERLQSPQNLLFIERALPTNLVPNRDVGVQLHGDLFEGGLSYAVGIFNGVPDGGSADIDNHDDKDAAARLFMTPFVKSESRVLEGFGLGVAGSYGKQIGTVAAPNLPTYKSGGQVNIFKYSSDGMASGTVIANGKVYRVSPQTYYSCGPFGLMGEYVWSSEEVQKAATMATLKHKASQVTVSFVLTGENASYKGVVPKTSFDPAAGTWGAFEIAARFNELDVDDATFPTYAKLSSSVTKADAVALGLNWYMSKYVRVAVDYEVTTFDGGAAVGDLKNERAILSRFQLYY